MANLRELILAADDRNLKAIEVPEWGLTAYTRVMNGHNRAKVEKAFEEHKGNGPRIMCTIVAVGLVDAEGKAVFTDAADAATLMDKSADVIERLYLAVMTHNKADAASITSAEGNSVAPPSAASS